MKIGELGNKTKSLSVLLSFGVFLFCFCSCGDDGGGSGSPDAAVDAALDGTTEQDAVTDTDAETAFDASESDAIAEYDAGEVDGGSLYELSLYVEGDLTPKTFEDGYSGQTPSSYTMGISRFEIMTSEDDANPVTVFDYGENYNEVDMLTNSLVGSADLTTIPVGVYTHGRVLLKMTRFDIETTVHSTMPPASVPGTMTVLAALSNTEIDGTERSQDWVQYTFNDYGGISTTGTLPELPTTAAGRIERENGETWLVFAFDQSLTIIPIPGQAHSATITYEVFESFRWEDQDAEGFTEDVFDSRTDGTSEPVMNFGATGYSIAVE